MIVEKRGTIDYAERGSGPAIVFVPGSCSTGAAWRPIVETLDGTFRCVTTSLLGYGNTRERRQPFRTEIFEEAEIVESVVRRAGGAVHLVGHSFGGLVALAVALRKQVPLLSLTILEAPAVDLLHQAGEEEHYRAFRTMTGIYFAAYYAGEENAVASMIDFYGGPGTFAAWPERVRRYAVESTGVNILDWENVYGFELTPSLLGSIQIPALVVWGGRSPAAIRRANGLIARHIRGSSTITIESASHFMINTHAEEMARAISRHVGRSELLRKSAA